MDEIKELIETLGNKIKAPIISSILFSSLAFNWKVFFYITFANATAIEKFAYFDMHTNIFKLLVIPVLIGSAFILLSPLLNHAAIIMTKGIKTKTRKIQADSQNELLEYSAKLERNRNAILEIEQERLLTEAKIDEKIDAEISDTNAKEMLKEKIKEIRSAENKSSINKYTSYDFDFSKKNKIQLNTQQAKEVSSLISQINEGLNNGKFLPPMSFEIEGYGSTKHETLQIGVDGMNAKLDEYVSGPTVIIDKETLLNLANGLMKFRLALLNKQMQVYGDISILIHLENFFDEFHK